MRTLIHEFRRYPTVENARRLREYFEHNPARVWVVRSEFLHVLAAVGVRGLSRWVLRSSGHRPVRRCRDFAKRGLAGLGAVQWT
jgi:hypothetical protein